MMTLGEYNCLKKKKKEREKEKNLTHKIDPSSVKNKKD